jgi:D-psicose/D-tagatose/L-ribulose 3-epimerase
MKFGVNTFIWSAGFGAAEIELLPVIREKGFDGVEIPLFGADKIHPSIVRSAMEANQLECNFCSVFPAPFSLISDRAEVRQQTVTHFSDCIKAAAEAGSKLIAGPLYSPVGQLPGRRRTSDEWKWAIEGYQQIGDLLSSYGVTIAIEPLNRFETYFLNTTADAVRLCEEINHPRVGILFDTFHANIEEKDTAAALRSTGKYLRHFHACENDRGIPGSGHVEWASTLGALKAMGYDQWVTIESFGFSIPEISGAAAIWRDLASSPEAIAWDGVRFLRHELGQERT